MPSLNWEQAKPFVYAGLGAMALIGLIIVIVLLLRKSQQKPTPMQLLVRNIRASTMPVPAASLWISGNAHMPEVRMGALAGVLYKTSVVAHLVKPSWARAGFAMLWRREILLTSPSDVEDLRGGACYVRGTGVMRYVDDVYWLHPDFEDATTQARWRRILQAPTAGASELLTRVDAYYAEAVEQLLAVQEQIAALDLDAQTVRAIPFDERRATFRDVQTGNEEERGNGKNGNDNQEQEVAQ